MPNTIDWRTLPAGRELDILVSQRVFKREPIETDDCNGTDNWWLPVSSRLPLDWDALPQYSTDIAAAWLVVGSMVTRGAFDLMHHRHFADDPWTARFPMGPDVPASHAQIHAATAPLAICRAALVALEG
jgi:hypothetical protein